MGEDIEFDADPMLFLAMVIEDQIALVESIDTAGEMFGGMPGMGSLAGSVADVGREKIAEAQAALDALIEEDTSWRPA